MKLDKTKALYSFLGLDRPINDFVIITPITKIFLNLKSNDNLVEENKGWWDRALIKINNKFVEVFKAPTGEHIKDLLDVLDHKKLNKIIFIGFCGTVNSKLKVGDIVVPRYSTDKRRKMSQRDMALTRINKKFLEARKIFTTSRIIIRTNYLRRLLSEGVDLLDMETHYVYSWANKNDISVISILIVTDNPLEKAFFCCGSKELDKIKRSICRITDFSKDLFR
jgi:hypothetical protein